MSLNLCARPRLKHLYYYISSSSPYNGVYIHIPLVRIMYGTNLHVPITRPFLRKARSTAWTWQLLTDTTPELLVMMNVGMLVYTSGKIGVKCKKNMKKLPYKCIVVNLSLSVASSEQSLCFSQSFSQTAPLHTSQHSPRLPMPRHCPRDFRTPACAIALSRGLLGAACALHRFHRPEF